MNLSPDSKFFTFCTKLTQLTVINLLWLLCSLPIFTVGAATTAMVSCLYRYRAGESCGSREFFAQFKKSFGKATLLWLLMLLFGIMLAVDYALVANLTFPGRMGVIGLIFFAGFALIFFGGLIFPILSQFPSSLKDMVINAVLLSLANLPSMLLVTAMNLLPLLLAVVLPRLSLLLGFFWLVCGCALVGLYDVTVVEKKIFARFRYEDEEDT